MHRFCSLCHQSTSSMPAPGEITHGRGHAAAVHRNSPCRRRYGAFVSSSLLALRPAPGSTQKKTRLQVREKVYKLLAIPVTSFYLIFRGADTINVLINC